MTAIDPATQIPATVNTVEKLVVYTGYLAENLLRGKEVKTKSNLYLPRAQRTIFTNADSISLTQLQQLIQIDESAFTAGSGKIWEYAMEALDAGAIPTEFLS